MVDLIITNTNDDLADMNGDGIVNILDIVELVDIILGE